MRSSRMKTASLLLLFAVAAQAAPQPMTPPAGIRENTPRVQAFVHARLVVAPGRTLDDARLVVRDGVIVAVGKDVSIPADAQTFDLTGFTVYAGFLDAAVEMGPGQAAAGPFRARRNFDDDSGGPAAPVPPVPPGAGYWNRFVTPE